MTTKAKLGIGAAALLGAAVCVWLGLRDANPVALGIFGLAFLALGVMIGAKNWKRIESAKEKAESLKEKHLG